jgi:hypothetical protein
MYKTITLAILMAIGLSSCEKDEIVYYLDSFNENKYYTDEIIPKEFQEIYGKWKLIGISGGFFGSGYEPDFDFMEIRSIGIYGLIRNDSIFEYGRIELDTFDINSTDILQIKIKPDYYFELHPYFFPSEKYIEIRGDRLALNSPCCDMYNYHFKRIK